MILRSLFRSDPSGRSDSSGGRFGARIATPGLALSLMAVWGLSLALMFGVSTDASAQSRSGRTGSAAAPSGPSQRIAAVVNDSVVSVRDLQSRMQILMATSGMPNTPETQQRLAPQVLRGLIDERLKMQAATKEGITPSATEITAGVRRIESQNNLPPGGLNAMFKKAGLDWESMLDQVRAEMAWIGYVRKALMGRVNVSDEEIDIYAGALSRNMGKPEYLVAEIFLAVDEPSQEAEVAALADRLIEQMRKGVNFSALAGQFSRASSAQRGGDMGWVGPGDIDEEVLAALASMQPGNLSRPIRTFGGYEIVLLRGVRTAGSAGQGTPLARIVLPTKGPNALSAEDLQNRRQQILATRGCDAFNALAGDVGGSSAPVAMVNIGAMPPPIQNTVKSLQVGQVSKAIAFDDAEVYVMTCERPPDGLPPREELMERLAQRKLEGLSQRRMRDLRQQAIIDIRI